MFYVRHAKRDGKGSVERNIFRSHSFFIIFVGKDGMPLLGKEASKALMNWNMRSSLLASATRPSPKGRPL